MFRFQSRDSVRSVLQVLAMMVLAGAFGAGVAVYPPLLRLAEIALVVVCVVSAVYVYVTRERELD
jgi:hypothetical protein